MVQCKRRTSISISIYAVIENYRRDLDKYYCLHLIILLGSSNRNCSIKSIQNEMRKGEKEKKREKRRRYRRVGRTKDRSKERKGKKKRTTIVDRYIKQVDVY